MKSKHCTTQSKKLLVLLLVTISPFLSFSVGAEIGWVGEKATGWYNYGYAKNASPIYRSYAEALQWTEDQAALPIPQYPEYITSTDLVFQFEYTDTNGYIHRKFSDNYPINIIETNNVSMHAEWVWCESWSPGIPAARIGSNEHVLYINEPLFPRNLKPNIFSLGHNNCYMNPGWFHILSLPVLDVHQVWTPEITESYPLPPNPGKNNGNTCPAAGTNPINIGTANKIEKQTDYSGTGPYPITLQRTYNSDASVTSTRIGQHWRHSYDKSIEAIIDATLLEVNRADGQVLTFNLSGGVWQPDVDINAQLIELLDGQSQRTGWLYITADDIVEEYDVNGRLISQTNRSNQVQTLDYALSSAEGGDDDSATLDKVTGPFGRSIRFTYDVNGQINTLIDPAGEVYRYSYDGNNNLAAVSYPDETPGDSNDNPARSYHYEDSNFPHALTGITDENGNRFATWVYDSEGRAISSEHAGGAEQVTVTYNTDNTTTVIDGIGRNQTYHFETLFGVVKTSQIDGGPCEYCGGQTQQTTYDARGFVASKTDFNGNMTTYINNVRGLEISRTEAVGTPDERLIETDWHNTFNRVIERREPGKTTTYTHNTRGQTLTRTETDTSTLNSRTFTYTYYETPSIAELIGQVHTVDGPRTDVTDVTVYNYYTTDDPGGKFVKGDLHTTTNAPGHVTEYLEYDSNGRPLQVKDANNVVTTMTYRARGWIDSRTTDGQTTSFSYDNAGNLTRVTQPDNSFMDYEYDDAHRLEAIADNFNNRIEYTLDAVGNRTAERTYNDLGVLRRQISRVYDQLSRLQKIIDGNLHETNYGYDNNGNRTSTQDPELNSTTFEYDALDRLIKTIDATLGETLVSYDDRDNLETVTDPLTNTTTYTYDGLDNQIQLTSPDTGITLYEYDDAGNRTSTTDARSVRVDYVYDALNRLVFTDYADNSLDVTFTYDVGTNGKGRLTSMTDAAGTETYSYDARGNLTGVSRTIGVDSYTTGYAYNGADRLRQITYPSGMVVDYTLDAAGRVTAVDKTVNSVTENLVTGVVYEPFGPVSNYTYGNGLSMNASFDQDFELVQMQSGTGLDWVFDYDNTGNILTIWDQATPANDQMFTYDDLYRLDTANGGYGNEDFDYDANGNRIRYSNDVVDDPYTYEPQSNRLATQNGWSFNRDAAGNRLDKLDGSGYGKLYSYGEHGRLTQTTDRDASGDNVVGTYLYDGRGQRISKAADGVTLHFIYGLNGELLGEFGRNDGGPTIKEYIYLNGQPVAVFEKHTEIDNPPPQFVVLDNGNHTSSTGTWKVKTSALDYGPNYREAKKKAINTYRWTMTDLVDPTSPIYVWWAGGNGYSKQVEYTISSKGGNQIDVVVKDQRIDSGQWNSLGNYLFYGSANDYVEVSAANGKTSADAIRYLRPSDSIVIDVVKTSFIHTDHLGTPRAVTDDTQTVVWSWDSTPFGDSTPNEDPDGDSNGFTLNLRFPGQYYDVESGLHYNYFRTYDPNTGRYVEGDPIGLMAGTNVFGYASQNPISSLDYLGLCTESISGSIAKSDWYADGLFPIFSSRRRDASDRLVVDVRGNIHVGALIHCKSKCTDCAGDETNDAWSLYKYADINGVVVPVTLPEYIIPSPFRWITVIKILSNLKKLAEFESTADQLLSSLLELGASKICKLNRENTEPVRPGFP